ncbi:flagellar hook-associated protein FlgL [Halanaerobium praevalens]|uniref:Flagellin n=1 Tax=Halanaerobium praevalens (strain ATCC 33744 / DSM 2228 / GSL) TaxID=572479 RepID=E3DR12_HALPG|nr:flagellar hook-associated protein FlgL [Halanaerobium praevalens]ADO78001.1 flagellin domain protein [Halanaerobium praevalens DSM 2228]
MRINTNIAALNSYNQLKNTQSSLSKSLERLSSGKRINKAADDAAGLAISEKMMSQTRGLSMAQRNAQDGISMIQTAEGALKESHSILQRMRELSVQAANDTNTAGDREEIQKEVDELVNELDRISNTTEFNTKKLLNGDLGTAVNTAVANVNENDSLKSGGSNIASGSTVVSLQDSDDNNLGIAAGDTVELSYVKGDDTVTESITIASGTAVTALTSADITTSVASGTLTFTAANTGVSDAVNGVTMTVKNASGEVKSAATDALSNFQETTKAADVRTDGTATFQIGANSSQSLSLDIENMSSSNLGVAGVKVETQSQANASITALDKAIQKVSAERSKLGSKQNRLDHTINNLNTAEENLTAAESRISDVDMAKEMMSFTKSQILSQAGTAMMAQANQLPQGVLQLLG